MTKVVVAARQKRKRILALHHRHQLLVCNTVADITLRVCVQNVSSLETSLRKYWLSGKSKFPHYTF